MEVASLQDPNTTTKYVSFNLYCDIMGKMDIMNKYFSGAWQKYLGNISHISARSQHQNTDLEKWTMK